MKKLNYLFIVFSLITLNLKLGTLSCSAQTANLYFNQVILYSTTTAVGTTVTVPAGKVWKIESCSGATACGSTNYLTIFLNGTEGGNFAPRYDNAVQPYWQMTVPLWLPAGTTFRMDAASAGVPVACYRWASIIEFNVAP